MKQASKDYDDNNTGSKKETTRKDDDNNSNNINNQEITKQKKQQPKEVFDSSKYNAMSDMTKGATTGELHDKEAMANLQSKERLKPEEISNNSVTTITSTSPPAQAVNPMVVEERARTIREVNEEVKQRQSTSPAQTADSSMQEGEDVKVVEREQESHSYNIATNWIEAMMRYPFFAATNTMFAPSRQYVEMMNAGMELYGQFMKGAIYAAELWFKPFQRAWFNSTEE